MGFFSLETNNSKSKERGEIKPQIKNGVRLKNYEWSLCYIGRSKYLLDRIITLSLFVNNNELFCRSANPLGKLMDFLQEDVDSMQRELDTWRQENKQLQLQLR